MVKRQEGFSLIELMITMVVFLLVIASASGVFTSLLTQFKQQSKVAETNIEGAIGLEILRRDLESAGYGLPWNGLITYAESNDNPFALNDAPTGTPRAIRGQNNTAYAAPNDIFNGSDYLVIKAINVAQNDISQKWTVLKAAPFTAPFNPRQWLTNEDFTNTENVIVLSMGATTATERSLVVSGALFSTTYNNITTAPWPPVDQTATHVVYGITPTGTAPQRPFNRADYYIWRGSTDPAADDVPDRCAPNTGVLRKAVLNHNGNFAGGIFPLLDCVADMQVVFGLDNDNDGDFEPGVAGSTDLYTNSLVGMTAANIRDNVKEIRVYILAHEGQRDATYTSAAAIVVGPDAALGRLFNLGANLNYRWKVYTLVVMPNNLV
ncbi:MAG: prepilin-type N-terminal cleavage/methylation domain-containing protein [Thermodesulfovibrionales bacterium]|nr:prepilin-type N-terminal cleavage/methylation domain-containing protein [Thermodesulfovibrionales bacterium]